MRSIGFIVIAGTLLQSASAETVGERTGVNAVLGISPTTADFVREAALSAMFEIEVGTLAKRKSDGATSDFAAKMVFDHTKLTSELTRLAQQAKAELPYTLDNEHQKKLIELKMSDRDHFVRLYRSDQVSEQKQIVSLYQRYAKGGENAALKAWAAKVLPDLEVYSGMARDLDNRSPR